MNLATKIVLSVVALLVSFQAGRYYASQSSETTNIDDKKNTNKHTQTVTTIVKSPSGAVRTTIKRDMVVVAEEVKKENSVKIEKTTSNTVNFSVLAGFDGAHFKSVPIYGVSISKEVLGPITVGAWGLTNGTLGLSAGVNF